MFFGQISILLLQYSSYIFSTPKAIIDFFKLASDEKKNILNNIFCTKKGGGLTLRSLANATTLGIRFHGISLFTNKVLFGDKAVLKTIYSIVAPISVVYRVLTTQSLKDYRETFGANNNFSQQIVESEASLAELLPQTENNNSKFKKLLLCLLGCLIGMSFFLRVFSTPVLCTGPIDDPEHNYDIKNTLLACFGLLLGVFASCQYCKFMWGLGKEAVTTVSNHRFFKSANLRNSPSLNNDNQTSYGSLSSAGPSRNMLRL